MVPVVFGTARLVVTMLLGLVPSWRSLLPSADQRERQRGSPGGLLRVPVPKHCKRPSLSRSFIHSFNTLPECLLCARLRDTAWGYSRE